MIIIIGLVILVAAVVVGVAGVLSNSGSGHALTHPFALFGYHVTGSTGTHVTAAAGPAISRPPRHPPQNNRQGQDTMSTAKTIAHKAEAAKGNIKQAGAKIKDASGH